jgi:MFS family permease
VADKPYLVGQMNNRITEKLWTGSFIKICLVNFFIFVNFHALLPTFPYFVEYLGGDSVATGLATALFCLASIISRPFLGWLVDTRGRFTILVAGLAGISLLPMGYFFAAGIAFAIILRTVHGAFHAASSNAASTWVADIIPRSRMGEGLGMFGLSMAISTAVAPALGLAIMNSIGGTVSLFGFKTLFFMTALSGLAALVIGTSIRNRNYTLSREPMKLNGLFEKKSIPASVTQFFYMMAYGVIEVYVAIYATKNGLPNGGVYFIFIAIATVLSRIALGKATDRYGEGMLVYTGNMAIIGGILLLVFAHNTPCYIISALLLGYSFGAIQPSLQTMAIHAVAHDRRGAASSTFFCAFDLGIALGGLMAGILIKYAGYDLMFLIIGISCVFSLMYYVLFGRNHESSLNPDRSSDGPSTVVPENTMNLKSLPLIITISREYGSGGHTIGKLLASKLGVRVYDRSLIEMTAKESGLSEEL